MTTDTVDIGETTNTLSRAPSHELELESPGDDLNENNAQPVLRVSQELDETTGEYRGEDEQPATNDCTCFGNDRFTTFDVLFILGGMLMYVADLVTDLLVAVKYFHEDEIGWSILTFVFVFFPSLILQYFSFRWFVSDLDDDEDHRQRSILGRVWCWCQWLAMHVLQLGAIKRYWRTLKYGLRSREDKRYYRLMIYEYRDITMLRLLEAFMESAPQLVLQVYIMTQLDDLYWLTAVSAIISLSSLAWGLEAYHKALRDSRMDKHNITYLGVALRIMWRGFTITARVISLALFAAVYEWWVFVVCGIHWLVMTLWLVWQATDFCETKLEELLFDGVMGIIHIFCFFNMKEGHTRYRAIAFYTLIFIENTVMFGLWYRESRSREMMYGLPALVFVWGGFFIGIFIMLFYYRFCHPSGNIECCIKKPEEEEKPVSEKSFRNMLSTSNASYATNGTDEVDSVMVATPDSEPLPGKVNLFSYRGRRTIDPALLASYGGEDMYVSSENTAIVRTPPQARQNNLEMPTGSPRSVDTCAVYAVDGNVQTQVMSESAF